jgi:hypothetical protein
LAEPVPTMRRLAAGRNYVSWQFGELKIVALRDGHVDMPLADGKLRLSVNA